MGKNVPTLATLTVKMVKELKTAQCKQRLPKGFWEILQEGGWAQMSDVLI